MTGLARRIRTVMWRHTSTPFILISNTPCNGQTIGREQLARDVRVQLAKVHAATSEFHRESIDSTGAELATETLIQQGRFEVRAFGIVHREWTF